jgi:hypothetical protein
MEIIPKKNENNNTCLKITFNQDITEDLGNVLPYPSKCFIYDKKLSYIEQNITHQVFIYYWYIDGFFGTDKAIDFINDIKARFLITYPSEIDDIRHFDTKERANLHLKQFQGIKSKALAIIHHTSRFDGSEDFIFWSLKIKAENLIVEHQQVRYDWLFEFALVNFGTTSTKACKDTSTLKSKCRSIVNYYIDKNFKLDCYQKKYTSKIELENLKMTRQENAKKISKERKEKNIKIIKNTLSGMFAADYKKPNGKWNVSKLSKDLKISRETIHKHLKSI